MRSQVDSSVSLSYYMTNEERIPTYHRLRRIKRLGNRVLETQPNLLRAVSIEMQTSELAKKLLLVSLMQISFARTPS